MAPLEVNVAELPAQIEVGLLTAVKVGVVFTVNITVFVPGQTKVFVPVTVYMVVVTGETETVAPINAPGFQV